MKLLSKAIQKVEPEFEKYENGSQDHRSRSNVTNFQSLLAFTMGHIPTKLDQFVNSSFFRFCADVQTDRDTQAVTAKNNTYFQQ